MSVPPSGVGPPSYHLKLSSTTVMDTTYVDAATSRPVFATITRAGVTALYRFKGRDGIEDVGEIRWNGGASGGQLVTLHGQTVPCEDFVRKSKGIFGGVSHTFEAAGQRCKWKSGETIGFMHETSGYPGMREWHCRLVAQSTSSTATAPCSPTQSTSDTLLARFSPPQLGLIKSELSIYPAGAAIIDELLLTSIMVAAGKSEWRTRESPSSRTRESLARGHASGLPLYRLQLAPGHQRVRSLPMPMVPFDGDDDADLPPYRSTVTVNMQGAGVVPYSSSQAIREG